MIMTYILIIIVTLWALLASVALVRVVVSSAEERDKIRLMEGQRQASLRAEVQALTECIVRTQGGTYLSPLTRNQQAAGVKATEHWFGKKVEQPVIKVDK